MSTRPRRISRSASARASARSGRASGVGYLIGKTIEGVSRQPEMRGELQGLMFLGLALTEAITFYALLMSFVAFFIGK